MSDTKKEIEDFDADIRRNAELRTLRYKKARLENPNADHWDDWFATSFFNLLEPTLNNFMDQYTKTIGEIEEDTHKQVVKALRKEMDEKINALRLELRAELLHKADNVSAFPAKPGIKRNATA